MAFDSVSFLEMVGSNPVGCIFFFEVGLQIRKFVVHNLQYLELILHLLWDRAS